jgi:hypothetical protein
MMEHFLGVKELKTLYRILMCFKSLLARSKESRNFIKEILCSGNVGGLDLRDQLNNIIDKCVENKKVFSLAIEIHDKYLKNDY